MNKSINMMSKAHKVKGQGVLSAYEEQVDLVKNRLKDAYNVSINEVKYADITHYHTINPEYFLTIPFTKIRSTTVGYVHFLPETVEDSIKLPRFMKKVFYRYIIEFYKSVDFLITVNPYFIDKLVAYGIDKEKVTYIPNYVSSKKFFPKSQDDVHMLKKKYNVADSKFIVLCVGQLQERKGIYDFIEVAKKMPDVTFVWAGGFSFKKISKGYDKIKKILENPPSNVRFLGIVPREEMNDLYNVCDVMFLPSFEELFPMSILESASCAKPILLRDIEVYEGILKGYYLSGNNVEDFVRLLKKLRSDEKFFDKASKMASLCNEYYSAENVAKMWRKYYNKIYKINMKKKRKKHEKK